MVDSNDLTEKSMTHILLTAGPTRAYVDDVRYLTNGSSGRMAAAIAAASLAARRDEVELDGLTSLSPRAQTLLSQHPQVRLPTRFL